MSNLVERFFEKGGDFSSLGVGADGRQDFVYATCALCKCSKPPSLYFVPGETISRMEREVVECEARVA